MNSQTPDALAVDSAPPNAAKPRMFVVADGTNVLVTFVLISSLFLLWGFCNGMIDVMDKHFQEELHLSLSQAAWVQFAHWMGYFLMALPAGWLATRLGYRGGIIAGLLLVAVGGFWFIPATRIASFWAFLLGVSVVASGLTFLETVANPYTTVLGAPRYAATRINLAQSCNGVGWIFGPVAGGLFFYAKDAGGRSTGAQTLWVPYAGVAVVVLILAAVFLVAPVPDIKAEDKYQDGTGTVARPARPRTVYALLLGNVTVLLCVVGMILWLLLGSLGVGRRLVGLWSGVARSLGVSATPDNSVVLAIAVAVCVAVAAAAVVLRRVSANLPSDSIWSHPHFSGATLAQFFYVAAQAGIFSFLINYMTSEPPGLPGSWRTPSTEQWFELRTTLYGSDIRHFPSLAAKLRAGADPVSAFVNGRLSPSTVEALNGFREGALSETAARIEVIRDLNSVISQQTLYTPDRFKGIALGERTRQVLSQESASRDVPRLNRLLLADAFPDQLAYRDGVLAVTNRAAATLASFGFICFLLGRVSGAALLRRLSANRTVGLYGALNVAACLLVFLKLGWISVACVFLSYFFMSIMFPTIFALGIFGLGARAKRASSYIVMAIVGGAILPKVMGAVADHYDMSRGFIVPLFCFALVACYGYLWPVLSGAPSLHVRESRAE